MHRNLKGFYRIQYSSPIGPRPSFLRRMPESLHSARPCGASASADRKLREREKKNPTLHASFHVIMILFSP